MTERKIKIFDTTLRDGEQSPGCSMNIEEKMLMAKQLERLGVDIIEAGFPISSPGDFESVKAIAKAIKKSTICGLARAKKEDIETAWQAIKYAKKPRIHTFLATSKIHMKHKLKKTPKEVLEMAVASVKLAKSLCSDVEFSAEDAGRSDPKFLIKIFTEVIKAGANVLNIPDTVGYTIPQEFYELVSYIIKNTPKIKNVDVSVHCHNDLGLATSNSLAAVLAGANQVECTINGIGERAGNAALEEVVMGIKTRPRYFDAITQINTKEIYKTSRLLTDITGVHVQPNKAIVGANAFAHEAGIHQDGILKEKRTYEIMDAASIGLQENKLVLGKHSGRHAFKERLKTLGYDLTEENLEKAFERFKNLADQKKEISDRDIESLIADEVYTYNEIYSLKSVQASSGTLSKPKAKVCLTHNGKEICVEGTGDGPVDAVYKTIDKIIKEKFELLDYVVQAVTEGTDAIGEVVVRLREGNQIFTGRGASTDIVVSSTKAYLNAINKLLSQRPKNKKSAINKIKPTAIL